MGKTLSIIAFILSLLCLFIPFVSIIPLILGIIAFIKSKGNPKNLRGLAIAAIVISIIPLIFWSYIFISQSIFYFNQRAAEIAAMG